MSLPSSSPEFAKSAFVALVEAFRLAGSSPRSCVSTPHLLLSLSLYMPAVRAAVGSAHSALRRHVLRAVEPIDDGTPGVEPSDRDDATLMVDAVLREARWKAGGFDRRDPGRPGWTAALRVALTESVRVVQSWGDEAVTAPDLLAGILSYPGNGAFRTLARLDLSRAELLSAGREPSGNVTDISPMLPSADMLRLYGLVSANVEAPALSLTRRILRYVLRRLTDASPVLVQLEFEAARQTVRHAHQQVTTIHLILAILEVDRQLARAGVWFVDNARRNNLAGELLREHRITGPRVVEYMAKTSPLAAAAAPPRRHRPLRNSPRYPEWSRTAAEAADRSRDMAKGSNEDAGSHHLLLSSMLDPGTDTARMVRTLGSDPPVIAGQMAALLRKTGSI